MALTADVVIIGGGVTGASTAYHLAARGMREVVVVDKSVVASGATGKSHGFKLSPAVGHMMAALITEGPGGHPHLPTFRLSRFAEAKPIRGTYGHWLIC
jgi:glycine/D-amino acid oxidase-like deaminating enzyme